MLRVQVAFSKCTKKLRLFFSSPFDHNLTLSAYSVTITKLRPLPCLGVLVKFWPKSCKKWLISWKSTRNVRFGQNLQLFEQTTMLRHFGQLFCKKVQKVAHFVKKREKWSIWPKLATSRGNYDVSAFASTFKQKVAHFVKNHEKSSIRQKLPTFQANYHVAAFWWTFQQKVAYSGSFREKARKMIDLAKYSNSSRKPASFGVLVNFSAKSCKKWLISWKSTKNHQLGKI